MLVITRRPGERLMIGENITVEVLSVRRRQIRLGIEAPREIEVYRAEVYQRHPPTKKPKDPPTD